MDVEKIELLKLDDSKVKQIEDAFRESLISQGIKYKSKTYYTNQLEFFKGVLLTLNALGYENIPKWYICISSGREIIESYKII